MNRDQTLFRDSRERFDQEFALFVAQRYPTGENPLNEVISYALLSGGKRVRALLCMESARLCGAEISVAIPAAFSLEMIHAYSLIHDDLPCMDNDTMRRGKPTTHVVYGEDKALLAGDALLTDAIGLIADSGECLSEGCRLKLVQILTLAAGSRGMVAGQMLDIYWTGAAGAQLKDLVQVHENKTGKLIAAACEMGAVCGSADSSTQKALSRFGMNLGLAFQVVDDLLDESCETGKTAGKDRDCGKLTYVNFLGREASLAWAKDLTQQSLGSLEGFADRGDALRRYAQSLLERLS